MDFFFLEKKNPTTGYTFHTHESKPRINEEIYLCHSTGTFLVPCYEQSSSASPGSCTCWIYNIVQYAERLVCSGKNSSR